MPSTLLDVGTSALGAIGQLPEGQTPSPEDGARILRQANLLLSQASTKRLMLYAVAIRSYTLSASTSDYTIGPTGDFVAARPTFLESCQCNVPGSSYWPPVNILDKAKWDAIPNRAAVDEVVTSVYVEYSYPNVTVRFHPKPSGTPDVRFGSWEPLTRFSTLFDEVAFPDGYEEWLEALLAVRLAPYYDQIVPPGLQERAANAIAALMAINAQALGGALTAAQKLETVDVGDPVPGVS